MRVCSRRCEPDAVAPPGHTHQPGSSLVTSATCACMHTCCDSSHARRVRVTAVLQPSAAAAGAAGGARQQQRAHAPYVAGCPSALALPGAGLPSSDTAVTAAHTAHEVPVQYPPLHLPSSPQHSMSLKHTTFSPEQPASARMASARPGWLVWGLCGARARAAARVRQGRALRPHTPQRVGAPSRCAVTQHRCADTHTFSGSRGSSGRWGAGQMIA